MEHIGILTVIVLILAAYRLTRLVVVDYFPFEKLRLQMHGRWLGKLMTCPFCSSVWIGGGLAAGQALVGDNPVWQVFIAGMAISAVVSLMVTLVPQVFEE